MITTQTLRVFISFLVISWLAMPIAATTQKGAALVPLSPLRQAAHDLNEAQAAAFGKPLPEEDLFSVEKDVKLRQIEDDRKNRIAYIDARHRFEALWLYRCVSLRTSLEKTMDANRGAGQVETLVATLDRELDDVKTASDVLASDKKGSLPRGFQIAANARVAQQQDALTQLQTKMFEEQIRLLKLKEGNNQLRAASTAVLDVLDKVIATTQKTISEHEIERDLYERYYNGLAAAVRAGPSKSETRPQPRKH